MPAAVSILIVAALLIKCLCLGSVRGNPDPELGIDPKTVAAVAPTERRTQTLWQLSGYRSLSSDGWIEARS